MHCARLVWYRKWLVLVTAVVVACATFVAAQRLPDIYTSETLILVDPQKVPETYVKSTVTGDIRNRLGTLSQQILSVTRLQKIIDTFNLYADERKTVAREDVIAEMRSDVHTRVASDFGGSQDLQAFRISYRGRDPRIVALVTNQLAALFIEENLQAREEQARGTTEFLSNQLQEIRKTLETQEGKLRDFKLRHLGEMPEQQTANLQILGTLQAQLQAVNESIERTQQQRALTQSLMAQATAVVDLDDLPGRTPRNVEARSPVPLPPSPLETDKAKLKTLLAAGYKDAHPDVRRLKAQIAQEEARAAPTAATTVVANPAAAEAAAPAPAALTEGGAKREKAAPVPHYNPVLQTQLEALDAEIAKQKEEQKRLTASITTYRSKVEAIPVREQQIADLQRDYEMSKAHYAQLLDKQLSAETATELEIRQKGEKFTVLDPAVPANRPSSPNRPLIESVGALLGVCLGFAAALLTELFGITIVEGTEITMTRVLEVIPRIQTGRDRVVRRRRVLLAFSAAFAMALGAALYLLENRGVRL